jgi:hypothetical protein
MAARDCAAFLVAMNTDEAFLAAVMPEPVTLLHQPLLPYSLGHQIILERMRSPFLFPREKEIPDADDLFLGVYICRHRYEEAQAALAQSQAEFREIIRKWVKFCGKELTELAVLECMLTFQQYVNAGGAQPRFRPIQRAGYGPARTPGAPTNCVLLAYLLEHGFSRSEALNCPLGMAKWLFCAHLEAKGRIAIVPSSEPQVMAKIREEAAKLGWQLVKAAPGCQVMSAELAKKMDQSGALESKREDAQTAQRDASPYLKDGPTEGKEGADGD